MQSTTQPHRQAGSLMSFIAVGIVLLALVVGGVYVVKQRGQVGSGENGGEITAPVEQPVENQPADEQPAENQPNQTEQPQAQPQPAPQSPQPTPSQAPAQTPNTGPSSVAATGPQETLMISTLGVIVLTYYGVHYLQSRRKLSRR